MRALSIAAFFLLPALMGLHAQDQTRADKGNEKKTAKHKVLLVPFEPRLYFGEIDYALNAETKLSSKQLKHLFRDGLNEQFTKALKSQGYAVTDLMEDTVKYKKDLANIYYNLSYKYLKVPDQAHYQVPREEKPQKAIEKGQLNVESNSDKRFMDARLSSPAVFTKLNGKYRCDLFLFINQLDLLAGGSNEPFQPYKAIEPNRKIKVHYTLFNLSGEEINSGLLEEEFSPELNAPKKIVDKHFSKIARELVTRLTKSLGEPATK